jgi:hypothetical protein
MGYVRLASGRLKETSTNYVGSDYARSRRGIDSDMQRYFRETDRQRAGAAPGISQASGRDFARRAVLALQSGSLEAAEALLEHPDSQAAFEDLIRRKPELVNTFVKRSSSEKEENDQ